MYIRCNTVSSLINTVTPPASDPCKQEHCEPKTETVTVSSTPASSIACECTDHKKETDFVTITSAPSPVVDCIQTEYIREPLTITTTITASQSPSSDDSLEQSQKSVGSSMAWMVVAVVFLLIALSAIVLSIIMGYLLHKKTKAMENTSACTVGANSKKLVEGGKVSGST